MTFHMPAEIKFYSQEGDSFIQVYPPIEGKSVVDTIPPNELNLLDVSLTCIVSGVHPEYGIVVFQKEG